jgi:hypothetical protein
MQRRQVAVYLAPSAAYLEGQPLSLTGRVRNLTDRRLEIALQASAGAATLKVAPEHVVLAPAQEVAVAVTGQPDGELLVLELEGSFGTRHSAVELTPVLTRELLQPIEAPATLTPARYLEAENLAHRSGVREADGEASGGAAWVVRPGQAEPGYVVFGPYQPLDKGDYLALFRVKRSGEGSGPLAVFDFCVGGGSPQTGRFDLLAEQLPFDQYRWVPVTVSHPGGQFEARVEWSGAAPLVIDAIALWETAAR